MMMSEETSNPPGTIHPMPKVTSSKDREAPLGEPQGEGRELAELRKEIIEARNLIIKTDNLLKNLHAELKLTSRKQEQFERRHLLTSTTAFIIFALLATIGAYTYARSEIHAVRVESVTNEAQAKTRGQEVEKLRAADAARRDASEKALKAFEVLASGADGAKLNVALIEANKIDRSQLSALEARALEDKEATLKSSVAHASHERGKSAFFRKDFRTAATEFARYVELMPNAPETPLVQYWLGESRSQLRDYEAAIAPLEAFMKGAPGAKNQDWATVLLGVAYEETGKWSKAQELYTNAQVKFPHSIHLTQMRNRLKRLPAAQAAAEAKKTAAVPPKP
jgi:TolA-binding protein